MKYTLIYDLAVFYFVKQTSSQSESHADNSTGKYGLYNRMPCFP